MARPRTDPRPRFFAKVAKGDGCWLWTGATNEHGYGKFKPRPGVHVLAHRFAYEAEIGPVPEGMYVLHHCDTPACVRPLHLFLGTQLENVRDMIAKGRQRFFGGEQQRQRFFGGEQQLRSPTCPAGHPREGNTRYKAGHPVCRICANEQSRKWRQKKSAA